MYLYLSYNPDMFFMPETLFCTYWMKYRESDRE